MFGGNVADHCKVMGHSTVRCAKTTEPIDMPFWMKIQVGPRNYVLDGGADSPKCRDNSQGLSGPFKSIGNHRCSVRCNRDRSIANNVMQQTGSFSMPDKRKGGGGIVQRRRSVISTIAFLILQRVLDLYTQYT